MLGGAEDPQKVLVEGRIREDRLEGYTVWGPVENQKLDSPGDCTASGLAGNQKLGNPEGCMALGHSSAEKSPEVDNRAVRCSSEGCNSGLSSPAGYTAEARTAAETLVLGMTLPSLALEEMVKGFAWAEDQLTEAVT